MSPGRTPVCLDSQENPVAATDKTALESEQEAVRLELLQLELEEKRENAAIRKSNRDARRQARETTEQSLADANAEQIAIQDMCTHRKGGLNADQIIVGNHANMAVVKNTLPFGDVMIVCQRCGKVWLRPREKDFVSKVEYKTALKDYRVALNFPTDNVTSGSQMFTRGAAA